MNFNFSITASTPELASSLIQDKLIEITGEQSEVIPDISLVEDVVNNYISLINLEPDFTMRVGVSGSVNFHDGRCSSANISIGIGQFKQTEPEAVIVPTVDEEIVEQY